MGKYFGTDGIRGIAGESLTTEIARRVGNALGKVFSCERIVVGKDTRESSDALATAVTLGALEAGVDVVYAGTVSTPMVAHFSRKEGLPGVMVTASHNPYRDNGIKVFDKGYKLSAKAESEIEAFIDGEASAGAATFGRLKTSEAVNEAYQELFENFGLEKANLAIAFDTANGATCEIAKKVLAPVVDEHVQIGDAPDGKNINEGCGSTNLQAIVEAAAKNKSDLGVAFDGDGDRLLVVDHRENVYDGDLLIYIFANYLKEKGELNKNTVVLTKMSNPGIIRAFKDQGIKVVQTDVGDKHVQAEMLKNDYTVGGENSGHIILNHLLQTGDGLLAAAFLLKIMHEKRQTLASLVEGVETYPQKTKNVPDVDKSVVEDKEVKTAIKSAKKRLTGESLLLVRPSGTEPLVRITVSHADADLVAETIEKMESIIIERGRRRDAE